MSHQQANKSNFEVVPDTYQFKRRGEICRYCGQEALLKCKLSQGKEAVKKCQNRYYKENNDRTQKNG